MNWYKKTRNKIETSWFSKSKESILAPTFTLGSPEYVGAFPVRQDITVINIDEPPYLRLGWTIIEE